MAISDNKITNAEIAEVHVQAAPDTLTGSAQQNKAVFDAYSDLIKEKHNSLIDDIDGEYASNWRNGSQTGSVRTTGSEEEGDYYTIGQYATAEGRQTKASESNSHAEGFRTQARGDTSHAEGYFATADGNNSHAEGRETIASGKNSHAEGLFANASGDNSHAEGNSAEASGNNSHAEGYGTIASSSDQHVSGRYNIEDTNNVYAEIIGNGTSYNRENGRTLDWNGNEVLAGKLTVGTEPENNKDVATKGYVDTGLAGKVDKVTGKGLSTEDYTTSEKAKLSNIESGAEVNVQADWETNDTNSDAYINNKPYIPNKTSDLTNDSNYATEAYVENGLDGKVDKETGKGLSANDYTSEEKALVETIPEMAGTISNKVDKETGKGLSSNDYTTAEKTKLAGIGDGAEANVQSDWAQPDTTADDYIKNKPPVPTKTSDLTNDSDFTVSDGTYDAMTVGMSKQLDTDEYEEDSVPYLFRKTGGTAAAGDRELDKIVGGSVVFNQLVDDSDFLSTGGIISTEDGVGSFTANAQNQQVYKSFQVIANHVYLGAVTFKTTTATSDVCGRMFGYDFDGITSTNWQTLVCIKLQLINSGVSIGVKDKRTSNWDEIKVKNYMAIDLTQMFGTTIADYVYQLEQNSAGSGVNYLKSLGYFTDDYYPYNAGEIKSVSGLDSHDMVGFNQWDEEWEVGGIDSSTGANVTDNTVIRSKNYIKVCSNTTYYLKCGSGGTFNYRLYDENKAYIIGTYISANSTLTIPSGASYLRFVMGSSYGTTYNNDICINISDTNRNGEYEPYVKHSYLLDNTLTLRGIPKLSDGKLYYDGDVYNSDGSVDRVYNIVEAGTLNWTYSSSDQWFQAYHVHKASGLCSKYETVANTGSGFVDKMCAIVGNYFVIKDTSFGTDANALKTSLQNDNVTMLYKLSEPTTESADPYSTIQICDGAGTEEYVTTGIPVGHETKYPIDLKGKLEKIPLVEPPKTNGTYTLKCTVSGGVPSYSWV